MSFFDGKNKSQVLASLEGRVKTARVLPQVSFSVFDWLTARGKTLDRIFGAPFGAEPLIVRSSSSLEDRADSSLAGAFESILNVTSREEACRAIDAVLNSYGDTASDEDMIFVQPMLAGVSASGVVFTHDPNNGAPYYVIDYALGEDTTLTTGGESNEGRTCYVHRYADNEIDSELIASIVRLSRELEQITECDSLDIEFGVNGDGDVFLFQVRPLNSAVKLTKEEVEKQVVALQQAADMVSRLNQRVPYVTGEKTLLGNMPDWNPAEMIGARPKALALSLYKEMITDRIWAYQRDNYGYKNLRSVPLLYSLAGSPYIDVRSSFYSFVPKMVSDSLAKKLVDYYLKQLEEKPELHDKIEFDIVFSCFTPSTIRMSEKLVAAGFSPEEVRELLVALRDLTNRVTHPETGEWRVDRGKIDVLRQRQQKLSKGDYSLYDRLFWLSEDCKRYGTLPFAGLARAAFVATQFVRALQDEGALSPERVEDFWRSLETVGSKLKFDLAQMDKGDFLLKYGHLRPGTYDITSLSYREAPDRYFDWDKERAYLSGCVGREEFRLKSDEFRRVQSLIEEYEIQHTPESLFRFIKAAIEGREYGKFVFSWSINEILRCIQELGERHGFTREECAYLNFQTLLGNYSNSVPLKQVMGDSIKVGKEQHDIALSVNLPSLIKSVSDIWTFEVTNSTPNFVTQLEVSGEVVLTNTEVNHNDLKDKIVLITNADPGFDWLLSAGVKGFVTCYGGANSHMAVRAMELAIPASIGVGERLFAKLSSARFVELSCSGKKITVLS
ncbi:PEP/pyruvate-binding domain-containing protein [Thalassospira sp. MIT1370]|uniref:PEP/pyruvate-binding domain-containing protein n=1 Tax=unclassified Thalassospira TaxID=2648997 RepID=UPI00399AB9DF